MKKIYKFSIGFVILTLILSVFFGCSKETSAIKLGIYVSDDKLASLSIEENGVFRLNRNIATNYDPTGDYVVDGSKLILRVNGDEKDAVEFEISENTFIFQSGKIAESLIEKGTKFVYEEKNEQQWDNRPMISLGEALYFDTGKSEDQLTEEWGEIGTIQEICSSTETMKIGESHYVANDFSVGTKIYGKEKDLNTIYVYYNDKFIEYILQNN